MAIVKDFEIPAHPSLFSTGSERTLKITFSYPEQGIKESTGILLLIPGYGEKMESEHFGNAREQFADMLDVVTIQCDYFGHEFMLGVQHPQFHIDLELLKGAISKEDYEYAISDQNAMWDRLFELSPKYALKFIGTETLQESESNFNDMGIMQAIDNISAVLATLAIINDNGYVFDASRVMIYGIEHGGYLGYLCNAFAPSLFTMLIDNSGYMFPRYLNSPRTLHGAKDRMVYQVSFEYAARSIITDLEILDLSYVYSKFINHCDIVAFHGTEDNVTPTAHKSHLCNSIPHCMFNEITKEDTDGTIIRNTSSGLGAHYIQFLKYVMENFKVAWKPRVGISLTPTQIDTKSFTYNFAYENNMLLVNRLQKL